MKTTYGVEIFQPDNARDLLVEFFSDSPFMAIRKGDILNTALWPNVGQRALRVVCVEHIIWESTGGPKHKLSVYTTEVPNEPTSRIGNLQRRIEGLTPFSHSVRPLSGKRVQGSEGSGKV